MDPSQPEKSLEDVLSKLTDVLSDNSAGNEDVTLEHTNIGGIEVVQINRVPRGEGPIHILNTGQLSLDWREKFKRHEQQKFPAFSAGEIIKAQAYVCQEDDGTIFVWIDAENAYGIDGRRSDRFTFKDELSQSFLAPYVGMSISIAFEIGATDGKYIVSDMWEYPASLFCIEGTPVINPTQKEIEALPDRTPVIVEGKFLRFSGKPQNEWYEKYESGWVETAQGEKIYLDFPYGKVEFDSGCLENLSGKEPEIGEEIAIRAYVTRAERQATVLSEGIPGECRLKGVSAVLKVASEKRLEEYGNLRSDVKNEIEKINDHITKKEYKEARNILATIRNYELTIAEIDETYNVAETFPPEERPILVLRENFVKKYPPNYSIGKLDKDYGVKIESMTIDEFTSFLTSALKGEWPGCSQEDPTSLVLAAEHKLTYQEGTLEKVLLEGFDTRLSKLIAISNKSKDKTQKEEAAMPLWVLIRLLPTYAPNEGYQTVLDCLCALVKRDQFNTDSNKDMLRWPASELVPEAVQTLVRECETVPKSLIVSNIDKLKDARAILSERATNTQREAIDHISALIEACEAA